MKAFTAISREPTVNVDTIYVETVWLVDRLPQVHKAFGMLIQFFRKRSLWTRTKNSGGGVFDFTLMSYYQPWAHNLRKTGA